jgi:hypothetical protein
LAGNCGGGRFGNRLDAGKQGLHTPNSRVSPPQPRRAGTLARGCAGGSGG